MHPFFTIFKVSYAGNILDYLILLLSFLLPLLLSSLLLVMLLYYYSILRICYLLFFLYREKVNLQKEISEAEEAIRKRKTEIEVSIWFILLWSNWSKQIFFVHREIYNS